MPGMSGSFGTHVRGVWFNYGVSEAGFVEPPKKLPKLMPRVSNKWLESVTKLRSNRTENVVETPNCDSDDTTGTSP